jgi:hypothetical protein
MNLEHDLTTETLSLGSDEERGLPKQPKKLIVANPSTPGVQTPNKPDGRDAPPARETRGELTGQALLDRVLPPLTEEEKLERRRRLEARRQAIAFVNDVRELKRAARLRKWRELRQAELGEDLLAGELRRRGSTRQARPGRRSRRTVAAGRGDPDEPPPPLALGRPLELEAVPA